MPDFKLSGADLKDAIKLARKHEMAFAFNPGKSEDEHFFALDRKKDGTFLGRIAKKEGTGKKVAFGRCAVDGKEMVLTCEEIVPGMARQLKKFLQSQKTPLKIRVLDADGALVEADGQDDEEVEGDTHDAPQAAVAPEANVKTTAAALAARLKTAQPAIKQAPGAVASRLQQVFEQVLMDLKAQNLVSADRKMLQLEAALQQIAERQTESGTPAQVTPDAKSLALAIRELSGQIGGLPAAAAPKLTEALKAAATALKGGDTASAATAVARIQAAVEKLGGQDASNVANREPLDGGKSPLEIWRDAKESTDAGISALQSALKSHRHPEMQKVSELGLNAMTEGNQTGMMKALLDFDRAPADQRSSAAIALIKQVEDYRSFITTNKFVDLCEQNPVGVSVAIKAPLGAALEKIKTIAQAKM